MSETNNLIELKALLQWLSSCYALYSKKKTENCVRLHQITNDCYAICELIAKQVENPEEYYDPDSYLKS